MARNKGLSARELLSEVFKSLQDELGRQTLVLPRPAEAEIANDSDWHRTRIGYTCYESAILVELDGKGWALALGTAKGSYPARPYNCDIAAIPFPVTAVRPADLTAETLYGELVNNRYFHSSVIYAMADGRFGVSRNGVFRTQVADRLMPRIEEFIAQKLETDPDHVGMDLRPIVTAAVRYRDDLVPVLVEIIKDVLSQTE